MPQEFLAEWTVTATADNAAATATKAAEAGRVHVITSIAGSFSASQTAAKLMTLKHGTTTIGNYHVHTVRDKEFTVPIQLPAGALAELSLPASGTAGQIGAVTMTGYTI